MMQTVEPSFRQGGKFGKNGHFRLSVRAPELLPYAGKGVLKVMMERQQQGGVCPYSVLRLRLRLPPRRPASPVILPESPGQLEYCMVVLLDSEGGRQNSGVNGWIDRPAQCEESGLEESKPVARRPFALVRISRSRGCHSSAGRGGLSQILASVIDENDPSRLASAPFGCYTSVRRALSRKPVPATILIE
ncbi:hypothetical protein Landi51_07743 [Colletotrichum acutatum]